MPDPSVTPHIVVPTCTYCGGSMADHDQIGEWYCATQEGIRSRSDGSEPGAMKWLRAEEGERD